MFVHNAKKQKSFLYSPQAISSLFRENAELEAKKPHLSKRSGTVSVYGYCITSFLFGINCIFYNIFLGGGKKKEKK